MWAQKMSTKKDPDPRRILDPGKKYRKICQAEVAAEEPEIVMNRLNHMRDKIAKVDFTNFFFHILLRLHNVYKNLNAMYTT